LPFRIIANFDGTLFVVTFHVRSDSGIVGLPIVKMPNQQVVISASEFTERDQIVRVKFQLRMQMKRLDMMDL
jgi:hypothetical protein